MSDYIDRQAAIDEIRKCRFVVDAIKKIRALPSAQPERTRMSNKEWIDFLVAQETNIWLKLDAFRFRCMEMVSCAGCPVRKNKAARDLCFRPCQEFTEAELDTLLACFDNASKEEANAKDETEN